MYRVMAVTDEKCRVELFRRATKKEAEAKLRWVKRNKNEYYAPGTIRRLVVERVTI